MFSVLQFALTAKSSNLAEFFFRLLVRSSRPRNLSAVTAVIRLLLPKARNRVVLIPATGAEGLGSITVTSEPAITFFQIRNVLGCVRNMTQAPVTRRHSCAGKKIPLVMN